MYTIFFLSQVLHIKKMEEILECRKNKGEIFKRIVQSQMLSVFIDEKFDFKQSHK